MLSPDATAVDLPAVLGAAAEKEAADLHRASITPSDDPTSPDSAHSLDPISEKEPPLKPPDKDEAEDGSDRDLEARVPHSLVADVDLDLDGPEYEYPEGGRGWWVVAGCTIIAAVTLGWGLAFGVFQSYYKKVVFPDVENSTLSVLGALAGSVMTPIAFVVGKFADRYGYKRFIVAGCACAFVAMLTAAFCTKLWQFFLTQGVLWGVCVGLVLPICMAYPSQWFRKKRGLATGIVIAGSSFGGGAASLIVQQLLDRLGLRYTLLTYAFMHLVLMTASVFMLKSRPHPGAGKPGPIQWFDLTLFRQPIFWSVALSIFITVFGYLPPYFYIEQYTIAKVPDLSPSLVAVPAAVMNFSAAIGRSTVGALADRIGVVNAFFGAIFISGLVQLLLWNFAESFAAIMVFSMVVGFFGAAFISLTAVLGAKLFGVKNLATLSGLLMNFTLPGNLAGAALAGAIFSASGGNWHAPITFSGLVNIIGATCILYARFKREPRIFAIY